jgi:DNA polymerase-3 subunit alpha
VEGRRGVGRYVSLTQLCAGIDTRLANKGVVEALVKAGAFDGFGVSRERLLAAVDSAMDSAQRLSRARASGQGGLFGGDAGETGVPRDTYPQSPPEWSDLERLQAEREALGFYLSGHPLSRFKDDLEGVATHGTATLGQAGQGAEVSVGGMMAGVTRRKTRKGDTMATFTLEDLEGGVEVVVFPDLYARTQPLFMEESPVLVTGRVEADETRTRILASEMVALSEARQSRTGSVSIRMPVGGLTGEIVERLKGVLAENRGACPVYFEVTDPGAYALTLKADGAYAANASRRMVASLEAILGPGSVRLRSRTGRSVGSARPAPAREA